MEHHLGYIANCKADLDFLGFLEELCAEYDNILLNTGNRGLSRGNTLQHILSLLNDIKAFMESRKEDNRIVQCWLVG